MKIEHFFAQGNKRFFFNNAKAVGEYVKQTDPVGAERIIVSADAVANQQFLFDQRWDMERTHQYITFHNDIDWLHQPDDDPEWVFALNRMKYWVTLGQAYALTGSERYAEAFAVQLRHWICNVHKENPDHWKAWRSIEIGLRLENWLKAMHYFAGSPHITHEVMTLFCRSVIQQAEILLELWDPYNLMSNWGVLASHGLFIAGVLLPDSDRTKEYVRTSIERLEQEIRIQVYRDGTHWEQSPMYHNEVLHCYLDVVLLADRNGIPLPALIRESTRAMCYVDLYGAKPDHNELCMGDSDEIDQRDLISRGAYLFGDGVLKGRGYDRPDADTAWEIGEDGIEFYNALEAQRPPYCDRAFSDSGNYFFRSGWQSDATYVHFHCGPYGAGHDHANQLHVDLFSRGEDVLLDTGRFTYVPGEKRQLLKGSRSHNTVMVDDRELYACKDAWACGNLGRATGRYHYSDERYGYVAGGELGYLALEGGGVYVNRRLIYLKPDILFIADEFYAKGPHRYRQFFHWGSGGILTGKDDHYSYTSGRLRADMILHTKGLNSTATTSYRSKHYNRLEQGPMVETAFNGDGFTTAYTIIALSNSDTSVELQVSKVPQIQSTYKKTHFSDEQIEAFHIHHGEKQYTVVIAHEEYASPTDTFCADGCVSFGNAVVFDRNKEETNIGTILQW